MRDLTAALGERVKELRERLGWSQEVLAEHSGLDATYVSGIERGLRNPGLNSLDSLARALRVSLPALVSDLHESSRRPARRGRPKKPPSR